MSYFINLKLTFLRESAYYQHERCLEVFNKYKELKLDALLSPGLATPSFLHGQSKKLAYGCAYTFLFNVLDMPTCAIPVTLVRKDEQTGYVDELNSVDMLTRRIDKAMKDSAGIPVGI
jgi:fatty acid amide hydrolase